MFGYDQRRQASDWISSKQLIYIHSSADLKTRTVSPCLLVQFLMRCFSGVHIWALSQLGRSYFLEFKSAIGCNITKRQTSMAPLQMNVMLEFKGFRFQFFYLLLFFFCLTFLFVNKSVNKRTTNRFRHPFWWFLNSQLVFLKVQRGFRLQFLRITSFGVSYYHPS